VDAGLRRCGLFELHSGAVIEPRSKSGVLIIGPSGSGKSTLIAHLAAAGWPYLSDDTLLIGSKTDDLRVWAMRRCFALSPETVVASRSLQSLLSPTVNISGAPAKQQFLPHEVFVSQFSQSCVPRTLFFARVSGEKTSRVVRLSAGDAMARLIRMSPWACYDRHTAKSHLSALASLGKHTSAFDLWCGKDLLDHESASRFVASYAGR